MLIAEAAWCAVESFYEAAIDRVSCSASNKECKSIKRCSFTSFYCIVMRMRIALFVDKVCE
eukprot:jgi/Botrbrau1/4622/Bobra.60_2s0105.1